MPRDDCCFVAACLRYFSASSVRPWRWWEFGRVCVQHSNGLGSSTFPGRSEQSWHYCIFFLLVVVVATWRTLELTRKPYEPITKTEHCISWQTTITAPSCLKVGQWCFCLQLRDRNCQSAVIHRRDNWLLRIQYYSTTVVVHAQRHWDGDVCYMQFSSHTALWARF
jgi:hypothetical protein